jgi:glycosyltransferase involved in cell wall biosynthesis
MVSFFAKEHPMTEHPTACRILALEPYYGGSHKDFLDQWSARSRHDWTLLTLPPFKWRWRMRHSALTFAEQLSTHDSYDLIFCSDMLNLSEFLSLCPPGLRDLPRLVYFHENQLTYPIPEGHRRDYHTAYMNFTTALCSTETWFNSDFHREEFFGGMRKWLKRMPDHPPLDAVERAERKSRTMHPAIHLDHAAPPSRTDLPHLLWIGRYDYDKNIELLRDALRLLPDSVPDFQLSIIGEQFSEEPPVYQEIRQEFSSKIRTWGYQESRKDYEQVLASADIIVSTANHEFFGMAIMEASASGAVPILPNRLAYPELYRRNQNPGFFYNGKARDLADKLKARISGASTSALALNAQTIGREHLWQNRIADFDEALYKLLA